MVKFFLFYGRKGINRKRYIIVLRNYIGLGELLSILERSRIYMMLKGDLRIIWLYWDINFF